MSQRKRKSLADWVEECLSNPEMLEADPPKKLVMLSVVHVQGGGELELKSIRLNQTKTYDAKDLAETIESTAYHYGQDLHGVQLFKAYAFHGDSKTPTAIMPFRTTPPAAEGGLMTEPPNAEGMKMQEMRWKDNWLSQVFRQQQILNDQSIRMIDMLGNQVSKNTHELHDAYSIVREMMIKDVELSHDKRMKELEFQRSTDERAKMMKAAPALINRITGREIFPQATEDTALVEMLAENITEDQVKMVSMALPAEVSGLLMARFKAALERKRKEKEAVEMLSKDQAERANGRALTEGTSEEDADGVH
jgi:hypothetical protein